MTACGGGGYVAMPFIAFNLLILARVLKAADDHEKNRNIFPKLLTKSSNPTGVKLKPSNSQKKKKRTHTRTYVRTQTLENCRALYVTKRHTVYLGSCVT